MHSSPASAPSPSGGRDAFSKATAQTLGAAAVRPWGPVTPSPPTSADDSPPREVHSRHAAGLRHARHPPGPAWPGLDAGLAPRGLHADPLDPHRAGAGQPLGRGPLVGLIRVVPLGFMAML